MRLMRSGGNISEIRQRHKVKKTFGGNITSPFEQPLCFEIGKIRLCGATFLVFSVPVVVALGI